MLYVVTKAAYRGLCLHLDVWNNFYSVMMVGSTYVRPFPSRGTGVRVGWLIFLSQIWHT